MKLKILSCINKGHLTIYLSICHSRESKELAKKTTAVSAALNSGSDGREKEAGLLEVQEVRGYTFTFLNGKLLATGSNVTKTFSRSKLTPSIYKISESAPV